MSGTTTDFICDKCGTEFIPEEGCYIGPADPSDTTCNPFIAAFTNNWKQLCCECNKEK